MPFTWLSKSDFIYSSFKKQEARVPHLFEYSTLDGLVLTSILKVSTNISTLLVRKLGLWKCEGFVHGLPVCLGKSQDHTQDDLSPKPKPCPPSGQNELLDILRVWQRLGVKINAIGWFPFAKRSMWEKGELRYQGVNRKLHFSFPSGRDHGAFSSFFSRTYSNNLFLHSASILF